MRRTIRMLALLAVAAAAACGGSGGYGGVSNPPPPPPDPRTVTATSSLTFGPASLTVAAGDVVTFDFQSVAHNVYFDAQAGAPADITGANANTTVTRVFTTAGTYH